MFELWRRQDPDLCAVFIGSHRGTDPEFAGGYAMHTHELRRNVNLSFRPSEVLPDWRGKMHEFVVQHLEPARLHLTRKLPLIEPNKVRFRRGFVRSNDSDHY